MIQYCQTHDGEIKIQYNSDWTDGVMIITERKDYVLPAEQLLSGNVRHNGPLTQIQLQRAIALAVTVYMQQKAFCELQGLAGPPGVLSE